MALSPAKVNSRNSSAPLLSSGRKVVAVIPAFNEEGHAGAVVSAVLPYVDEVILVDDGSSDATGMEAADAGAVVYTHVVNRGLGGALSTGLRAALIHDADVVVTLDADGQHSPSEIPAIIAPITDGQADFVIGSRLHDTAGMPWRRRLANGVADTCTYLLFGVRVADSQSGFRGLSRQVAEAIDIRSSRMEVSSEIAVEVARKGFKTMAIPIPAIYTDYSLSKGQGVKVGLRTLAKLILRRFA